MRHGAYLFLHLDVLVERLTRRRIGASMFLEAQKAFSLKQGSDGVPVAATVWTSARLFL
jgi:hypothetical protein